MRHRHADGLDLHPHDHHGRGQRHHRGHRLFDPGELRLLLLAMIAQRPRHGYELIRTIEERFGGGYTPSPGVIYPTLSWLDDMGYAVIEAQEPGRKCYRPTDEGQAFLTANRAAADELLARRAPAMADGAQEVPAPLVRAMENLKLALRLRLAGGPLGQPAIDHIAATLDAAAQTVERS